MLLKLLLLCESTRLLPFYQESHRQLQRRNLQYFLVATSGNRCRLPEFEVWQPVCTFKQLLILVYNKIQGQQSCEP